MASSDETIPESLYSLQAAYPYPVMGEMPAIRAAFDHFFQTVQTKEDGAGNVAMFSRASQSIPVSTANVWNGDVLVSAINRKMPVGGARVHLVATFADLPQHVQDAVKKSGVAPSDFFGVTMAKGQIFITQDTHLGLADLEETILHELYGHAGVKALFGPEIYKRLNRLYLSLGNRSSRHSRTDTA